MASRLGRAFSPEVFPVRGGPRGQRERSSTQELLDVLDALQFFFFLAHHAEGTRAVGERAVSESELVEKSPPGGFGGKGAEMKEDEQNRGNTHMNFFRSWILNIRPSILPATTNRTTLTSSS